MQNLKDFLEKYWHLPFIAISILLSLKFRVLNPWNGVFTWTVRLGGNDPWYYYRLIESTIHNFPSRIWFDPFTHYPYGSYIHFGPFLVYLGAISGIITGHTSGESLRSVLAFIPAVGGILVIFPAYILVREVFDKKTAVIAAIFTAIVPGQFLQRSILGFSDHHVWEVFWMTSTMAALIYSYNRWSDRWMEKENILLAAITGIVYGLYIDTWAPAFAFGMVIVGAAYLGLLLKKKVNLPPSHLPLLGVVFLVSALVYLPFAFVDPQFGTTRYSPFQLAMLLLYSVFMFFLWQYDRIVTARFSRSEIALLVPAALALVAFPVVAPGFFGQLSRVLGVIHPKGGALTVAEVYPFFFTHSGEFTLSNAFVHFGTLFFFALPGMVYAAYRIFKTRSFVDLTLVVWAIALFVALWGQNRFAYYFAIVTVVYASFVMNLLLEKLHFYRAVQSTYSGKVKYSKFGVVVAVLLILAALYPTYALADVESVSPGGPQKQWYDALMWMRENTPDGERYDNFYYALYPIPQSNKKPYNYPFETYGVISWWDYGHWIESIAHRMPIANPFQHGIGNKYNNVPGASSFFTATNESYAEWIASELDVRYVVSDIEMETGKFYAMAVWAEGDLSKAGKYYDGFMYFSQSGIGFVNSQLEAPPGAVLVPLRMPGKLYYRTMEARLHLFDGSGLSHYRMVYESAFPNEWRGYMSFKQNMSESDVLKIAITEAYRRAMYRLSPTLGTQEVLYKYAYNRLYSKDLGLPRVKLGPSGYVKIFERVRGAVVTGKVPDGVGEVVVNVTIKTNQNRSFEYYATAKVKNGTYSIVLPYAQDTDYPVKPITPYYITAGNVTKTFTLSERDVTEGNTVTLDLI